MLSFQIGASCSTHVIYQTNLLDTEYNSVPDQFSTKPACPILDTPLYEINPRPCRPSRDTGRNIRLLDLIVLIRLPNIIILIRLLDLIV